MSSRKMGSIEATEEKEAARWTEDRTCGQGLHRLGEWRQLGTASGLQPAQAI
ncbi:MAG: hypothetical protein R3E58_17490 [Phycisphaerae bacterium]